MKIGIRLRILLVSLAVMLLSVLLADAYLIRGIETELGRRIEEDLFVRLDLIEREISGLNARPSTVAEWDAIADDLGRRARSRLSIIARDGTVLGDSELDLTALAREENHARRPEITQALVQGRGSSRRFSSTFQERLLYVAEPFQIGGQTGGCVRLSVPLTEVDDALGRLRRVALIGSVLALLVAALLAAFVSRWVSGALRSLTNAARRMASGDLSARVSMQRHDEVAELAGALNHLAGSLSSALEDLRNERDLLGRVLDSMREGVLLLDREGRIVLANPALREMLSLGMDIIGRMPLEVIRSSELQRALDEAGRSNDVATAELEVGEVEQRRLMVRAAPFPSSGGLLAVFIEVTELRRLETIRRDFVANVSHELRTPVAVVLSAAETLHMSGLGGEAGTDFLGIIERNAGRLQQLLEDLLDLTRIESRELKLDIQSMDLGGAIQHTLELFGERAHEKGLELSTRLNGGGLRVRADAHALEQVLVNLVDNAIKYCTPGATVTVGTSAEGERVRVSVEDTGPGIEPKHLPRLFERFYRVDAGRSRDLGGTGLGLAIVKHWVEAMGGTVMVDSSPGRGSVFSFTLRAADVECPCRVP
jgi:two-component system phosphate regulon sensor histidine kinase PhoR